MDAPQVGDQDGNKLARRILAERLKVYAERSFEGALSSPVGTLLLAWAGATAAGWRRAALWWCLFSLIELLILTTSQRYRRAPATSAQLDGRVRRLVFYNFLAGIGWGASVWFFSVDGKLEWYLFNLTILVGVAGISIMVQSPFRASVVLFFAGLLLPPIVHAIVHPLVHAGAVAIGLAAYYLLLLQYGRVAGAYLVADIESTLRNADLTARLSLARDVVATSRDHLAAKNTELQAALGRLALNEQHLHLILDSTSEAIYGTDMNGACTFVNQACLRLLGHADAGALIGRNLLGLVEHAPAHLPVAADAPDQGGAGLAVGSEHAQYRRADGSEFPVERWTRPMYRDDIAVGAVCTFIDISERKRAEQRIAYLAYHDTLTDLPNRILIRQRFNQDCAHAARANSKIALLFLDLDNFKTINDSLGHLVGDALIQEVARRLTASLRETDSVSRQGGDEFLIVLPVPTGVDEVGPILAKLIAAVASPIVIDGTELGTSASIGVAVYPDDGGQFDLLLKKADMAMYQAKEGGRNTYRFYDEQMNVAAQEQLRMRNGLRRGLEHGEFTLHYQPQFALADGALIGAEALLRWNHPEFGLVAPGRFIAIAEDCGLIIPIGEWVLREACRQAVAWQRAGMAPLMVGVNLSAVQFRRGDIEQTVMAALAESGLDPALLELELTESILIQDSERVLGVVRRLKGLGVRLSIDDFGTGYSSLSYLKRFEVDKLKIDQAFVRDLAGSAEDAAIVVAIIQLARSLGLLTIAEGVETAQVLDLLRTFGCDQAQGYHCARPMANAQFCAFRAATLDGCPGTVRAPALAVEK